MRAWTALLLALIIFASLAADADAKHVIKAYYNGQEATVTGVKLKVGEPFTVDLYVTPDRYTTVAARLREPGGGLESYRRISGDDGVEIVRKKGGPNDTVHFQWVLAPTDDWTGGTAPLNLQYDVWGETMDGDVQGYFTVVEAYISPVKYERPLWSREGSHLPYSGVLRASRCRAPSYIT
jgi:sarcinarray family protein